VQIGHEQYYMTSFQWTTLQPNAEPQQQKYPGTRVPSTSVTIR
jgi:hypothetical protein